MLIFRYAITLRWYIIFIIDIFDTLIFAVGHFIDYADAVDTIDISFHYYAFRHWHFLRW
jgi:hypothetical protein